MSTLDKEKARILTLPKNYTFDECDSLLRALGYECDNAGKTSGSRVKYTRDHSNIHTHKPHPSKIMKRGAVKDIVEELKKEGLL